MQVAESLWSDLDVPEPPSPLWVLLKVRAHLDTGMGKMSFHRTGEMPRSGGQEGIVAEQGRKERMMQGAETLGRI